MLTSPLTIGAVSMLTEHSPERNLQQICDTISSEACKGVGLLVFPECSIQGYPIGLGLPDLDEFEYQTRNAEKIPGGATESIRRAIGTRPMVVVFGTTEAPDENKGSAGLLFNTSVAVSSAGVLARYRKVHTGGTEKSLWTRGSSFTVADTNAGRLGFLLCYDVVFPEASRTLALEGTEILVLSTAWARTDSETFSRGYDLFTRCRALENQIFLVAANLVDSYDPGFFGHSRIIDPTGTVISECPGPGIAIATINVREDILRFRSRSWLGQVFLRDRAPSAYRF